MRAKKLKNISLNYNIRNINTKLFKNKSRQMVANKRLRDEKGRLISKTAAKDLDPKEEKIGQ